MDFGLRPARRSIPALTIYNVRKLPANYLIDRKGDIVAKDLYGTSLEQQLEKLL